MHTDYLRGTAPTHTHGAVKACIVIAGPTLVALIPMAAAPALPAMAQAFKDSGNGALFAQLVVTAPAIMVILGAPLAGILTVRGFLYTARISFGFGEAVDRIRAGTAQWGALTQVFKQPKRFYQLSVLIGAASLVMFAGGALGACIWLLGR